ncbi:unnamed protein product [Acidocella sp. C78]|uniref:ABC transporter ATP-binding protein n=1 Tax=Acidocella sp. C78 TaxID=1671486 RepID=UPI00191BAF22|nr:ABC transporter ATP-binding protein [Acidocella sp. C78]CAG4906842.1 unnamed protein product [Acidocella sp. C78]
MLSATGLHVGYGPIEVIHGIDFKVETGEIVGLLGRNGMGKTTLIRGLNGSLPARSGRVVLDGEDITHLPMHLRSRRGIATIVQGRGIFPKLTVWENLEMGRIAGGGQKVSRLDEVIGYFPRLGERLKQLAGSMSGGEQQMLAIGRSLMSHPKVLLLDEPSDGIMPILVQQIAKILAEINRREKMTIVIVEQNVPMVFSLTSHCIILEKGRIVAEGNRDDIADSEIMKEYLAL